MTSSQQDQRALSHFNLSHSRVSFPSSKPAALRSWGAMKAGRLAVIVWGSVCLELPKSSILRALSLFDLYSSSLNKPPSRRLSLFDLTQSLFSEILYLQSVCQKQSEQLFNITFTWCGLIPVGQIRGWQKSLTLVNRMSAGSLEKLT